MAYQISDPQNQETPDYGPVGLCSNQALKTTNADQLLFKKIKSWITMYFIVFGEMFPYLLFSES